MKSVFSLNNKSFSINVLITDSLNDTYIIQMNGTADTEGSELMTQASERLLQSHIGSIILDFSKTTSVTTGGWNFIIKLKSLLEKRSAQLYLMRMPPSVYTHFTAFEFKNHFSHFRAFGDIIRHIKSREEEQNNSAKQSYSGSHPVPEDHDSGNKDKKQTQAFKHEVVEEEIYQDSNAESKEAFPLSRSRKSYKPVKSETPLEETTSQMEDELAESQIPERMIAIRGKLRSLFEMKIYDWKSLGYDTSYLDSYLDKNLNETKKAFSLFAANLNECRQYREILEESDHTDLEKAFKDFSRMTFDPMNIDNIREAFKDISNKINRFRKQSNNPLFDYNFENFIKGESNRETYEMAYYLTENLHGQTRPVYIYGRNGTGKTHIMNASGNKIRSEQGLKVNYITASEFIDKYDEYKIGGHIDKFRSRYTECDVILFDDIHMLDKSSDLLLEFRLIYEKAIQRGIHLFIASALMPGEFESLSKDIESRFNNSVFLTLSQPDMPTMTAIIRSKLNFSNIPFSSSVPEMVARLSEKNIRQALGYINTIALYHETYKENVTEDLVRSLILSEDSLTHEYIEKKTDTDTAPDSLSMNETRHEEAETSWEYSQEDTTDGTFNSVEELQSDEIHTTELNTDETDHIETEEPEIGNEDFIMDSEPSADTISESDTDELDEHDEVSDTGENVEDDTLFEDDFDFDDDDSSWDDDDNDDPFAL